MLANPPPFRNEPYTDFSVQGNRERMEQALAVVRSRFGQQYDLRIGENDSGQGICSAQ